MLTADWLSRLGQQSWFANGANLWQWGMSAVGLLVYLFGFWVFWQHRCHVCRVRAGKHKVKGSTAAVCDRHHLAEHHERLREAHRVRHPDRLGHGESPGAGRANVVSDRVTVPLKPAQRTHRQH